MRLFELRKSKNVNQDVLSNVLQTTRQAYSRYERGEREPDIKALIKLADYFDCSIDYLVGRIENEYQTTKPQITNNEKRLLEAYNTLTDTMQDYMLGMIQEMASQTKGEKKKATNV